MSLAFFDRIYVVHLPNEKRRQAIEAELARLGRQDATFLHAEKPAICLPNMRRNPLAEWGVNFSHIKAVVRAIADGAERPLILEDDVIFEGLERLPIALSSLPPDWDVLYLGGHPRSPVTAIGAHLVKVGKFSIAEAYSLRRPALLGFHEFWLNRIGRPQAMYDFILGEFASSHRGFAIYPVITRQALNCSQISGITETKDKLVLRGWQTNLSSQSRADAGVL